MQPQAWPALRQDLSLHDAAPSQDGSPGWVLHDVAVNRFYRLGWPAFEIVSRWALADAGRILDAIHQETTLQLDTRDIEEVLAFLQQHQLLQAGSAADTARLSGLAAQQRLKPAMWLLKHYLFFRIPLLRPAALLDKLAPAFAYVFHPAFWQGVLLALVLGLFLVSQRWDAFLNTFASYQGLAGLLGIGVSLSFAKVLHEFGHALTAHRYGCRVPAMGVAFLVMFPVLYTDTNESWKLPSRRQRLHIGAAGMLAELVLAVLATLCWSLLPDGPLRAGAFMLATTTWVATLAINASPFMRFDGYFLLSDWLDMPNLHARAFAFGRYWLRRQLLGLDDLPPEPLSPGRQQLLTLFAFATWLYRLVLFLGIALLVYHYFFKALGLVLFVVELGWFIAYPLWSELAVWWQRRSELRWQQATYRSAALLVLLLVGLVFPWRAELSAPAVMGAARVSELYAPAESSAEVAHVAVRDGQQVRPGQLLLGLQSSELQQQLRQAQADAEALRWRVAQQPFADQLMAEGAALSKAWQLAQTKVEQLQRQASRLQVLAPHAGVVREMSDALQAGTFIPPGERLLAIVGAGPLQGDAFVNDEDRSRVQVDGRAVFISDSAETSRVACRIGSIDQLPVPALDKPVLASLHGGAIASHWHHDSLQPLTAQFRIRLVQCQGPQTWLQEQSGQVWLQGQRQSLVQRWWHGAMAVLQREAGL